MVKKILSTSINHHASRHYAPPQPTTQIRTHVHIHTHTHAHAHMHPHACTVMYTCTHPSMCMRVHMHSQWYNTGLTVKPAHSKLTAMFSSSATGLWPVHNLAEWWINYHTHISVCDVTKQTMFPSETYPSSHVIFAYHWKYVTRYHFLQ